MTKKNHHSRSSTKKKRSHHHPKRHNTPTNTWIDHLGFEDILNEEYRSTDDDLIHSLHVSIISWNCLAQSYLSPRSHHGLPLRYQDVVFRPRRRQGLLKQTLERLASLADILCLQEVDLHDLVHETLQKHGFQGLSTPTSKNGIGDRVDACCIYYDQQDWELVNYEYLRLDDIATLGSSSSNDLSSNLQGLMQSFLRRNVGLLVRLLHKETQTCIVVCNCHLYWNPEYDYIKLCQAHYALEKTLAFAEKDAVIFSGDLNSRPGGPVHTYLTQGYINARRQVAPWYCLQPLQEEDCDDIVQQDEEEKKSPSEQDGLQDLVQQLHQTHLNDETTLTIKYMLDFTLNRFTRWLRILGIDAALETAEQEIQRTKHGNVLIFNQCRREGRTLITTSSKLLARKDCPAGAYLINPKTQSNLEAALVHLLLSHGVALKPATFLTRCVVCNGSIQDVTDVDQKKRIFKAHNAPELDDGMECYECYGCGQGYWWCDRPSSSASRVKAQATRLLQLCLRGGVDVEGPLHMFDHVNLEEERSQPLPLVVTEAVIEWLKQECLECPIQLESAYAFRDNEGRIVGECKPFTNVTSDFVGFLDYVWFQPDRFQLAGRLYLPGSFQDLNGERVNLRNGHLLPSNIWPSDHLSVGALLSVPISSPVDDKNAAAITPNVTAIVTNDDTTVVCGTISEESNTTELASSPMAHNPRCQCGCVPPVLSLFEMAELRNRTKLTAKEAAVA